MFFDDRLATVLRHRAVGENAARTQFRQLLDLLGNRKYGRDESLIAAAWLRLGALGEMIPAADRARMVAERGWRFRSPELAAHLAEDEPAVAAAALARANLTEEDWEVLIPRLPVRARGFLRLRRDLPEGAEVILDRLGVRDRALPQPEPLELELDEEVAPPAVAEPRPQSEPPASEAPIPAPVAGNVEQKNEISALVERIARFRREREAAPETSSEYAPLLPLEEAPARTEPTIPGFAFAADATGRIEWAESRVAPMVIGKRLVTPRRLGDESAPGPLARAFARQQVIDHATIILEGAPAICGEWLVDAHPRFARSSGRFHGYVGRFRRPAPVDSPEQRRIREADRIRQLLHELRTPVNAMQGFAEVIQQQLFGPAPNEYRALAANIAGDAARILAGFDELERLAKLESGALSPIEGESDLAPIVRTMVAQLEQVLAPRMATLDLESGADGPLLVALEQEEAEALAWRLLATLAGACSAGEVLLIGLAGEKGSAKLDCGLPAQLIAEDDIFSARVQPASGGLSSGLFGAGFSLRLARAEARAAGGDLVQEEDRVRLTLPLLAAHQNEADDAKITKDKVGRKSGERRSAAKS